MSSQPGRPPDGARIFNGAGRFTFALVRPVGPRANDRSAFAAVRLAPSARRWSLARLVAANAARRPPVSAPESDCAAPQGWYSVVFRPRSECLYPICGALGLFHFLQLFGRVKRCNINAVGSISWIPACFFWRYLPFFTRRAPSNTIF